MAKQINEAGLTERAAFMGWVSDKVLGALYAAADAVVIPSRYEPFGLVALEAAACAAPVLVSDIGGLGEIARRSHGAILTTQPNDPKQLAASIERLLADSNHARKLGRQAREHVIEDYPWESVANRIGEELGKIIEA